MTNEQYSEMMVQFAKLEAKIEKLEQQLQFGNVTHRVSVLGQKNDFGLPLDAAYLGATMK